MLIKRKESFKMRKLLIVFLLMGIFCLTGCIDDGKIIEKEPFYSLQAAYNNKFLSKREIKKIHSLYSGENSENLDTQLLEKIVEDYKRTYPRENKDEQVIVNKYLGTYDKVVVLMIRYEHSMLLDMLRNETVARYRFEYSHSSEVILVWRGNE